MRAEITIQIQTLMENKIPTAEEFLDQKVGTRSNWICELLVEFAKLHVKAALEAASKSNKFSYEGARGRTYLNAYPEENIK
jgi:hypothetical protein